MVLAKLLISLLYLHHAVAQEEFFLVESPLGDLRLTAERGGPPPGAEFQPIRVVNNQRPFGIRPTNRPRPFPPRPRPPPPPPIRPPPNKRPRPMRPVAPQPLPIPIPSTQGIPTRPQVSVNIPQRPPAFIPTVTDSRPDLETVSTTTPPSTTTPNAADKLPAYYQRFIQNEDGSYYFDFANPNGIQRLEQGFLKRDEFLGTPIMVKTGAYRYTSPEGQPFRVDFVADERGYRPFTSNDDVSEQLVFRSDNII